MTTTTSRNSFDSRWFLGGPLPFSSLRFGYALLWWPPWELGGPGVSSGTLAYALSLRTAGSTSGLVMEEQSLGMAGSSR
ncbi:hypothetical protein Bca101_072354 [Brassica carinata]